MNSKSEIIVRIPKEVYKIIQSDLCRPHDFALERVGFVSSSHKRLKDGSYIILIKDYHPVADKNYIEDPSVGARINSDAIREALQRTISEDVGVFHIHHHCFSETVPKFSYTDLSDNPEIVKSLSYANKNQAHGMIVTGRNGINVSILIPGEKEFISVTKIVVVGYPLQLSFPKVNFPDENDERYDRQSFLGENSQFFMENVRVGIVGLGGGGSHFVQQLAHLGFRKFVLFDPQRTDITNINRNVGTGIKNAEKEEYKIDIAVKVIRNVIPDADIIEVQDTWQNKPEKLQTCDIVFGGVDLFIGRSQLEAECRRYLIPLIDIGMDVHDQYENEPPSMSGQVILSMPGMPCFRCLGFITDENQKEEAAKYGDAGGKPQVVWANGTLASNAIGIGVDLITGWTGKKDRLIYTAFDGNRGELKDHIRHKFIRSNECIHYPIKDCGPAKFSNL